MKHHVYKIQKRNKVIGLFPKLLCLVLSEGLNGPGLCHDSQVVVEPLTMYINICTGC